MRRYYLVSDVPDVFYGAHMRSASVLYCTCCFCVFDVLCVFLMFVVYLKFVVFLSDLWVKFQVCNVNV